MTERISVGLEYLVAIGVGLSLVMFFLLENGRANAFATYLLAIAVLAAMFFPRLRAQLMALPRDILLATVCLLEYLALSAFWSDTGGFQVVLQHQGYAALILCFVLGLAMACRRDGQFLPGLAYLVLLAAGVSAAYSIYLHVSLPDYQPLPEPRLYGLGRLSNPVISAASYGVAGVLGCWLLMRQRAGLIRLCLVLVLALLGLAILLSGTRTVWLALAVAVGAGFALGRQERGLMWFAGVFGVMGLVGLLSIGWEDVVRRGLSFRPDIWSEFIGRSMAANPLLGVGSGTESYWETPVLTFQHPHSVFVSAFFFGGLVGLGLLLLVLVTCARHLRVAETSEVRTLAIMLLGFGVVFSVFDGDNILTKIDYLWWLIWLPIGVCLCLDGQRRS